jgi:hypothetical protein
MGLVMRFEFLRNALKRSGSEEGDETRGTASAPLRIFCTYFDRGYLERGLALYRSLEAQVGQFRLYVLCLDDTTYDILLRAKFPSLVPLRLVDLEACDRELFAAKGRRSQIEYYFTITACLCLFIFDAFPEIDSFTYLDADLFFYASPEPVFAAIGDAPIAITPHRFTPFTQGMARHGIYNVGWISWRRDARAFECLRWYRAKSLEWCADVVDGERYADQKYLDRWPEQFSGVYIVAHKGANLAPWNVGNYQLSKRRGKVFVDDDPLVFYHFHDLKDPYKLDRKPAWASWYLKGLKSFDMGLLSKAVYRPYIDMMCRVRDELAALGFSAASTERRIRHVDAPSLAATSPTWRNEMDWTIRDDARNEDWHRSDPWTRERREAVRLRNFQGPVIDFDAGALAACLRLEGLISIAAAKLAHPADIVDLSLAEAAVDHAFEVMPRVNHQKWIAVASTDIRQTLDLRLPTIKWVDDSDSALAQPADILIEGGWSSRSQNWVSALRRLAAAVPWMILDLRTFSGTPTTAVLCRETGSASPRARWILNRVELGTVLDAEGISIIRELVLPNPVRIAGIPELADQRFLLVACPAPGKKA